MFMDSDGAAVDLSAHCPSAVVRLSRYLESQLYWICDEHLCVSKAMGLWLSREFHIDRPTVLYDRPPGAVFGNLFISETIDSANKVKQEDALITRKCNLLSKLELDDIKLFPALISGASDVKYSNSDSRNVAENIHYFKNDSGEVGCRLDAAALIVSSTSWTADEDFSILERCIWELDARLRHMEWDITVTGKAQAFF